MAINLQAIRDKIAALNGQRKNSSVQLWKPAVGQYRIRVVPWKSSPDGDPCLERKYYYLGEIQRFLAPSQFGKPDPINDLIRKLYSTGKAEDRELAKKLRPKSVFYMPIVVRGEESKNVQVWACNVFIYQRLLGFFTDEDVGEKWTDPHVGQDLKVTVTESKKTFNGKKVLDHTIDVAPKVTKLSEDPAQLQQWIDIQPDINSMYTEKTPAEITKLLNDWLAGGATTDSAGTPGTGTETPQDELAKLAADVKATVLTPAVTQPVVKADVPSPKSSEGTSVPAKPRKSRGANALDELTTDAPVAEKVKGTTSSLDAAFDELMDAEDAGA